MTRDGVLLLAVVLTGCGTPLEVYQSELTTWYRSTAVDARQSLLDTLRWQVANGVAAPGLRLSLAYHAFELGLVDEAEAALTAEAEEFLQSAELVNALRQSWGLSK